MSDNEASDSLPENERLLTYRAASVMGGMDMFQDAFEAVCNAAKGKADFLKKNPLGYFVSAMIAGLFIAFGSFVSNAVAAPFFEAGDPMQKFMSAATFSVALSMVVMAGAELFTGNNFVLGAAGFAKKLSWGTIVKVWVICYIGNWVGSLIAAFLFQASGAASGTVGELFASASATKMGMAPLNLVLRGIFCNTLVCLAVWCGTKLKSESGKLIMVFLCIITFMLCGFEHSVANMTTLAVGLMNAGDAAVSLGGYFYNLLFVTIGNLIGGVIVVALPYYLIAKKTDK